MSKKRTTSNISLNKHDDPPETNNNPVSVYLGTLTSKWSRIGQKQALDRMAVLLGFPDALSIDWSKVTPEQTATLPEKLVEVYAPGTVNRYIGTLKGVLKQAYLLGQMSEDNYRRAIKIKRMDDSAIEGRLLSHQEISALMQACNHETKVGARDAAIIALMYAAGLRPTELGQSHLNSTLWALFKQN